MTGRQKITTAIDVRLCGVFAIIGSLVAAGYLLFSHPRLRGIHHPRICLGVAAMIFMLGVGTTLLRRWAAVVLSLFSAALGLGVVYGIIRSLSFSRPAELLVNVCMNSFIVLLLFAPLLCTIGSWKDLP